VTEENQGKSDLKFSVDQLISLCETAEKIARASIFKRVPKREVRSLDISIEINPSEPITLNVEIGLTLSPVARHVDINALVREAVDNATRVVDKALSKNLKP
jgi:hypothetical protein